MLISSCCELEAQYRAERDKLREKSLGTLPHFNVIKITETYNNKYLLQNRE